MSNKPVTEALKKTLADTHALGLKTLNYHWNVEGRNFSPLHLLFEGQYKEIVAATDEIAERIRALGEKAPASYSEFSKLTAIKEGNGELDDNQMVKDLYTSQQTILATLKKALATAQKAGDESTADLLIGRVTVHDKAAWMLKSSLPAEMKTKLKVA